LIANAGDTTTTNGNNASSKTMIIRLISFIVFPQITTFPLSQRQEGDDLDNI